MRFSCNHLFVYGGWNVGAVITAGSNKSYILMNNRKNNERCDDMTRLIDLRLDRKNRKNTFEVIV